MNTRFKTKLLYNEVINIFLNNNYENKPYRDMCGDIIFKHLDYYKHHILETGSLLSYVEDDMKCIGNCSCNFKTPIINGKYNKKIIDKLTKLFSMIDFDLNFKYLFYIDKNNKVLTNKSEIIKIFKNIINNDFEMKTFKVKGEKNYIILFDDKLIFASDREYINNIEV